MMHHPSGKPPTARMGWRKILTGLVLAAMTASCGGGDKGTEPADLTCETETVSLCSSTDARLAAVDATSDAAVRSTPALDNVAGRTTIATRLGRLQVALTAGNVTDARAALISSREGVTAARAQLGTYPGDAADLAAIDLVLDQVAPLLGL